MSSLDTVKSIGYILVLMLVFSPIVFLVANTFVDTSQNNCYEKYPNIQVKGEEGIEQINQVSQDQKRSECQQSYDDAVAKTQTTIFIIVSILSILTLLVLLLMKNIAPIISYGLFFGVSINIIRLVWGFDNANSFVAAGLGIVLFIVALIFINNSLSTSSKSISLKNKEKTK